MTSTAPPARRGGAVTALLARVLASDRRCAWTLAAASLVLVRCYFARGDISWSGDGSLHLTYAAMTAAGLRAGQWPLWTFAFACGSPFLQFYGFAFFLVAGALDLLVRDINLTVKLVLAAGHVLSGVTAFWFLRLALRSRAAALVGGLAFVLTFWHMQQVLIMGRLPLSLFYALLPVPFACFERARLPGRAASSLWGGGLGLAGLVFVHPGYAAWATAFLALYAGVRAAPWRRRRAWRRVAAGAGIAALGLLLSASLWLPMWWERGSTGLATGIRLVHVPDPSWQQLLAWSNYRLLLVPLPDSVRHWFGGYLGLSLAALAVVGLAGMGVRLRAGDGHAAWRAAWRAAGATAVPAAGACLLASLVLVFGYRWRLLQEIDAVQAFNAGRYLLFTSFFLAATAAAGARWLLGPRPATAGRLRRLTVVVAVILLDLGPTTFQQPYAPARGLVPPDGPLPPGRNLALTGQAHRPLALALLYWETGRATPQGIYDESSISWERFCLPWTEAIETVIADAPDLASLRGSPWADLVFGGLRLLNVDRVYVFADGRGVARDVPDGAAAAVAAPRLEPFIPDGDALRGVAAGVVAQTPAGVPPPSAASLAALTLVRGMDLDDGGGAARIYTRAGAVRDLGTRPRVAVDRHAVTGQRVHLGLHLSAPGFVRLAYSWNPSLEVRVDGERVDAVETAGGYLAIELPAGEHAIELIPHWSGLRRALAGLDATVLLAGAGMWWRRRRR